MSLSEMLEDESTKVYGIGSLSRIQNDGKLELLAPGSTVVISEEDAEDAEYEFSLKIFIEEKQVLDQVIGSDMNLAYDNDLRSMTWLTIQSLHVFAWQFSFNDQKQYDVFKGILAIALWETEQQSDFKKTFKGKADRNSVIEGNAHMGGIPEEDEDNKDEVDAGFSDEMPVPYALVGDSEDDYYSDEGGLEYSDEEIDNLVDDFENKISLRRDSPDRQRRNTGLNTGLEIGTASDRTFVFRDTKEGTMMGVFGEDDEGKMGLKATIKPLTFGNEIVKARKHLLHDGDTKMLILDDAKENSVLCMDLETEQIIEEWEANTKIRQLAPREKYSQKTAEKTLVGTNLNSLFMLDQRLNTRNKMVMENSFTYKKAPKLSCVATNEKGQAVVGDKTGQIRFFSHLNKRSKTNLPGLGDPIVGVDVTADGKWALATTAKYLLVIPTEHTDGKRTAFDVGLRSKPVPIKLQLDHKDILRFNITSINFTRARFNAGSGEETWIVTSTGRFIITWNLKKVKNGRRFAYKIKKCAHEVVQDDFAFNDDEKIVVLEKNHFYVERRNKQSF